MELYPGRVTFEFDQGYMTLALNRIAKLWNTLPESTLTFTSFNQFKSHVLQRCSAAFRTNYK